MLQIKTGIDYTSKNQIAVIQKYFQSDFDSTEGMINNEEAEKRWENEIIMRNDTRTTVQLIFTVNFDLFNSFLYYVT